jgi:hypothetical protein
MGSLAKALLETDKTKHQIAKESGVRFSVFERAISGQPTNFDVIVRIVEAINKHSKTKQFSVKVIGPEEVSVERDPEKSAVQNDLVETLNRTVEAIPLQNETVQFRLSDQNRIHLVPTLADENDYETIETLRSELLSDGGPIKALQKWLEQNPNVPQCDLFEPLLSRYSEELSKDPREINYVTLYARGAKLYAARKTAQRQIASDGWPELGADEDLAISDLCDVHGPLIMASAAGRRMVVDAHQYETTAEVYKAEQDLIHRFSQKVTAEKDLFETGAIETIDDITSDIPNDPQPARSRGARLLLTGSLLTVFVGGAAWLGAGGLAMTAAGALGGGFLWETLKKTKLFSDTTGELANKADKAWQEAETQAVSGQTDLLARMAKVVEDNRALFQKISELRPEFGWVKKFLVGQGTITPEELPKEKNEKPWPAGHLTQTIVYVNDAGSSASQVAEELADILLVPHVHFDVTKLDTLAEVDNVSHRIASDVYFRAIKYQEPRILEVSLSEKDLAMFWNEIGDVGQIVVDTPSV